MTQVQIPAPVPALVVGRLQVLAIGAEAQGLPQAVAKPAEAQGLPQAVALPEEEVPELRQAVVHPESGRRPWEPELGRWQT